MLITKVKPVGIDWYIQQAQTQLYNGLAAKWGSVNYDCYGRCYRNKKKDAKSDGYVAEVYAGSGEYKEVYWNDNLDAISFFGISDKVTHEVQSKVGIHLVFFLNLDKVKPGFAHRPDEEVRQDVIALMSNSTFGMEYQSTELWIENVLREYGSTRRDERLTTVDMHPIHCFRLNYILRFNPKKLC